MNFQKFRRILEWTLLLPLVLLLLLAIVLAWQIRRTLAEQRLIDHSDRIAAQLNDLERLFAAELSSLRDYQLSHDSLTLTPLHTAAAPVQGTLNQLDTLIAGNPEQELLLRKIRDSHAIWLGAAGAIQEKIRLADAGKPLDRAQMPTNASLQKSESQARNELRADVRTMIRNESSRRQRLIRGTASQVRLLMTVLISSAIGLAVLLGAFTATNLSKVLKAFRNSLEEAHARADELSARRQWLKTTLDSVGDGLISCDRLGRIDFMNPVAQHLTGWSLAEARHKDLDQVFRTVQRESRHPLPSLLDRTKASMDGTAAVHSAVLLRKDGAEFLIEDRVSPIRAVLGEVTGMVLTFRDVTEQRQAEAALIANEKLVVAGRLAASIAHEIHNPLDAVANLLHLLQHENDAARRQRFLDMAQQELNRTLQISRAMLGLYREPNVPVEVNLRELIESVLLLLERRLADEAITVERRMGESPVVEGFPGELRQVFTNVLTNAAEAAGRGGRLRIQIEDAPSTTSPGAIVIITDSGPGVPDGMEGRLFQPFVTTKGERGTGLGLWVSRGIVEKHGGVMNLTNSTDHELRGAAVRVCLPAHFVSAPA